jgi:hypothetical protein
MTQEKMEAALKRMEELIDEVRYTLGVPSKAEIRDLQNRADDLYDRIR